MSNQQPIQPPSDLMLLNERMTTTTGASPTDYQNRREVTPENRLEGTVDDRVNELFERIGGCGLFQVFAYFAIAFGMSSPSWFIYEIGYFTQAPDEYICKNAEG